MNNENNYSNSELAGDPNLKTNKLRNIFQKTGLGTKLRIFLFTWNVDNVTVPIENHTDEIFTEYRRMIEFLKRKKSKVAIFCFQNDKDHAQFTTKILVELMQDAGFIFPGDKKTDIGEFVPAIGGENVLRNAIFVQEKWWTRIKNKWWNKMRLDWYKKLIPNKPKKIILEKMANILHFTKKCNVTDDNLMILLSTFLIPGSGKFGVMNVHFKNNEQIFKDLYDRLQKKKTEFVAEYNFEPRGRDFLKMYDTIYEITRQKVINEYNSCLMKVIEKAKEEKVDYLFVAGTVNYRVKLTREFRRVPRILEILGYQYNHISRSIIAKYDEVASQFRSKIIEPLLEGIDNGGPTFPPTCLLQSQRPDTCQQIVRWTNNKPGGKSGFLFDSQCYSLNTAKNSLGAIGWCNRIFYKTMNPNIPDMECIYYNSMDLDKYYMNSYRPVIGIFEI